MKNKIILIGLGLLLTFTNHSQADDGSLLWLKQEGGKGAIVMCKKQSPTIEIAVNELREHWTGGKVFLTVNSDKRLSHDGFSIRVDKDQTVVTSPSDKGLLYGAFYLLRQQATGEHLTDTIENPAFELRILNHWDNLDGTVERGFAGHSLWKWEELPRTLSPRYEEYARANASIGINATVLNNVNASPKILDSESLLKIKALADVFRPYGIRVFLSVNFASPITLGNLPTADPLNAKVRQWWKNKVKEIYQLIPDFGGFLVKANSEGQPGPCDYGRSHADGANLLADVLKPYRGIVMWRAFVYSPNDPDRAKQAYKEFQPLDGLFRDNVVVQVKNGPVDFQPREPYSPLFTGMNHTSMMAEFQITQEYLGHSNHIAFLATMWKEFFDFVSPSTLKAIAGVSNIGDSQNWCGYTMAQANWYAFGRLAWNPALDAGNIAEEWIKQTYLKPQLNKQQIVALQTIKQLMLESRDAVVNYMMPLGLHHIFAGNHHYGPEPWYAPPGLRADWTPPYYHQASSDGIGFDRTVEGTNAVSQYPEPLRKLYNDAKTCPDAYLLWFHHLPWNFRMKSGNTLWNDLCFAYEKGVNQVRHFQKLWDSVRGFINIDLFKEVEAKLQIQVRDAVWWKDACLLYFQEFSDLPFPAELERPIHQLSDLKKIKLEISMYECPPVEMLNAVR